MTTSSDAPIRTCVGCRRRRPQTELHRCVLDADGVARVDRRAPGRGAWLCGIECLEPARRRRGFERAWRRAVPPGALDGLAAEVTAPVGADASDEPTDDRWGSSPPLRD